MKPQRIIWHHSADDSLGEQFDKINTYHKSQGFPKSRLGFYVGYHWLIEADGTTKQARLEDEIGAHDQGENIDSIGICFAGNFIHHGPTDRQAASAEILLTEIRSRWPIPITRIEPHRQDDTTECPGNFMPDNWLINTYLNRSKNMLLKVFAWIAEKEKLF